MIQSNISDSEQNFDVQDSKEEQIAIQYIDSFAEPWFHIPQEYQGDQSLLQALKEALLKVKPKKQKSSEMEKIENPEYEEDEELKQNINWVNEINDIINNDFINNDNDNDNDQEKDIDNKDNKNNINIINSNNNNNNNNKDQQQNKIKQILKLIQQRKEEKEKKKQENIKQQQEKKEYYLNQLINLVHMTINESINDNDNNNNKSIGIYNRGKRIMNNLIIESLHEMIEMLSGEENESEQQLLRLYLFIANAQLLIEESNQPNPDQTSTIKIKTGSNTKSNINSNINLQFLFTHIFTILNEENSKQQQIGQRIFTVNSIILLTSYSFFLFKLLHQNEPEINNQDFFLLLIFFNYLSSREIQHQEIKYRSPKVERKSIQSQSSSYSDQSSSNQTDSIQIQSPSKSRGSTRSRTPSQLNSRSSTPFDSINMKTISQHSSRSQSQYSSQTQSQHSSQNSSQYSSQNSSQNSSQYSSPSQSPIPILNPSNSLQFSSLFTGIGSQHTNQFVNQPWIAPISSLSTITHPMFNVSLLKSASSNYRQIPTRTSSASPHSYSPTNNTNQQQQQQIIQMYHQSPQTQTSITKNTNLSHSFTNIQSRNIPLNLIPNTTSQNVLQSQHFTNQQINQSSQRSSQFNSNTISNSLTTPEKINENSNQSKKKIMSLETQLRMNLFRIGVDMSGISSNQNQSDQYQYQQQIKTKIKENNKTNLQIQTINNECLMQLEQLWEQFISSLHNDWTDQEEKMNKKEYNNNKWNKFCRKSVPLNIYEIVLSVKNSLKRPKKS